MLLKHMIRKFLPWFIGLVYILSPIDIIPEYILGPGFLDDLAVLGFILWYTTKGAKRVYTRQQASRNSGEEQKRTEEETDDPYEILGLKRDATEAEIKEAFKRLASQYHPDKVQHLGKEFQELAHKKFVRIKRAYELLTK